MKSENILAVILLILVLFGAVAFARGYETEGYNAGYEDGYSAGYAAGYEAGAYD